MDNLGNEIKRLNVTDGGNSIGTPPPGPLPNSPPVGTLASTPPPGTLPPGTLPPGTPPPGTPPPGTPPPGTPPPGASSGSPIGPIGPQDIIDQPRNKRGTRAGWRARENMAMQYLNRLQCMASKSLAGQALRARHRHRAWKAGRGNWGGHGGDWDGHGSHRGRFYSGLIMPDIIAAACQQRSHAVVCRSPPGRLFRVGISVVVSSVFYREFVPPDEKNASMEDMKKTTWCTSQSDTLPDNGTKTCVSDTGSQSSKIEAMQAAEAKLVQRRRTPYSQPIALSANTSMAKELNFSKDSEDFDKISK
ncbi:uncharacterized protein [Venturia canescens]|uniref:uncharacterized protein n=1 Tax=Venturia canescens TaxID=32260 RepID=UPI001C9CF139|nr:uncharacterized protein LOC122411413 [Venturia canescens]